MAGAASTLTARSRLRIAWRILRTCGRNRCVGRVRARHGCESVRNGTGYPPILPTRQAKSWRLLAFDAHAVEAAVYEEHRDQEEDSRQDIGKCRALLRCQIHGQRYGEQTE